MSSWTNVGTLCSAIQNEWSSFLSKVSAHEQQHVNFIQTGFAGYGDKIVGKTLDQAVKIFNQMAAKVQKNHDSIDPPNIPMNINIKCESQCSPGTHLETTCGAPSCVIDGCHQFFENGGCGVKCESSDCDINPDLCGPL